MLPGIQQLKKILPNQIYYVLHDSLPIASTNKLKTKSTKQRNSNSVTIFQD